jgi:hypothetical protein
MYAWACHVAVHVFWLVPWLLPFFACLCASFVARVFFLFTCLSLQMLPLPAHFLFRILFAHRLSTCLCMSGAASKLYGCISPCCATIFLLSCTVSVPLLGLLSCSCLSVRLLSPVPSGCTCFVSVVRSVWLLRPLSLRKLVDTVVTKPRREEA